MKKNKTDLGAMSYSSDSECDAQSRLIEMLKSCPIPDDEILSNLGLFLTSKNLSRILFMEHIYRKIVETPGVVLDLGTRWGNNMCLFSAFRSMYEPFHRHRKILGFDTFEGFLEITEQDGESDLMTHGNLQVGKGYEKYLDELMSMREKNEPLSHIQKYRVIKGDAIIELKKYLQDNPQTIIALAYFDFDLYKPTKECLQMMSPHLTKGSVLAFDELNDTDSPGETIALHEVLGLRKVKLYRLPHVARAAYCIIE